MLATSSPLHHLCHTWHVLFDRLCALLLAVLFPAGLQLCFDFIQSAADGRLYCIECNPRTSSVITEFHDSTQLAAGEPAHLPVIDCAKLFLEALRAERDISKRT
jgi:hypothetical protein